MAHTNGVGVQAAEVGEREVEEALDKSICKERVQDFPYAQRGGRAARRRRPWPQAAGLTTPVELIHQPVQRAHRRQEGQRHGGGHSHERAHGGGHEHRRHEPPPSTCR